MKVNVRKIVKFVITLLSLFFPDNDSPKGDDPKGGKGARD
jgi:hypothetical protein